MNKQELTLLLEQEKKLYLGESDSETKAKKRSKHKRYYIWRYLYYFRLCQYYRDARNDKTLGRISRLVLKKKARIYERKKNVYSYKSGVEIGLNSKLGKLCNIWHGGVVINGEIGDNCVFHGNNIIGNKGIGREHETPLLGNNVSIGAGACIIGNIIIADRTQIGAGSVVTKSFELPDSIITGVPGALIK